MLREKCLPVANAQAPKQAEAAVPRVCHDSPLLKLWHKPCVQFETPKAVIYLQFACPEVRMLLLSVPVVVWPPHLGSSGLSTPLSQPLLVHNTPQMRRIGVVRQASPRL